MSDDMKAKIDEAVKLLTESGHFDGFVLVGFKSLEDGRFETKVLQTHVPLSVAAQGLSGAANQLWESFRTLNPDADIAPTDILMERARVAVATKEPYQGWSGSSPGPPSP